MATRMVRAHSDDWQEQWRQELRAAYAARSEIGPEYEAALAESFAERALEYFTEGMRAAAPAPRVASPGQRLVLAVISAACVVPVTGIVLVAAALAAHVSVLLAALLLVAGVVTCCATLVSLNVVFARPPRQRQQSRTLP